MSCCPPSALPYLAAKPATKGSKKAIESVEFYETGAQSKAAIILFPDVWGWDSGRTRALADAFAEQGYRTYVPKVLQPAHKGGTDGDGLPPDFDLATQGAEFMEWVVTVKWDGIDAKVNALLAYAKKEGADSIGVVGCCWGGWACFETSAMSKDVKVGVIFHPSCHIVAAHGGEVHALAKKVQAPHYIMPAKSDDPALYGPEGSVIKELPAGSKQKTFPEQEHGWTSRGDASDPAVAAAIKDAMTEAFGYLKEHLPLA